VKVINDSSTYRPLFLDKHGVHRQTRSQQPSGSIDDDDDDDDDVSTGSQTSVKSNDTY